MADTDKKIMPAEVDMPNPTFDDTLQAGQELRINAIESHIKVLVGEEGLCEVFGRELPVNEPVYFHQGEKIAIFAWKPSKITITGNLEFYTSDQTPMHIYINVQCVLNRERNIALQQKRCGPNLLVTGSQQSGKSTLCKILVNYAVKLGWQPTLVDLDLNSAEISPPGSISAALVNENTVLPSDSIAKNSISYFHGDTHTITNEFFNKQMNELATAVRLKQENDLAQFLHDFQLDQGQQSNPTQDSEEAKGIDQMQEIAQMIRPVFPEMFASGTIINGFTPDKKEQTDTLMKAIQSFRCGVVLVIDNEKLERDITNSLEAQGKRGQVSVVKVPKSQGIHSTRQTTEEQENQLYSDFQDYFCGMHCQAFANSQQERAQMGLQEGIDPQRIPLPLDKIKIFEVIGHDIQLSALPAGSTQPEETTFLEEIRPQDLEKNIQKYKHRILAASAPRDVAQLKQLEAKIAQNPNNDQLKEEFKDLLLRSCTLEFLQIREFRSEQRTQKKQLEVIRTCAKRQNEAAKGGNGGSESAGGDIQPLIGEQSSILSEIFGTNQQTGYFIMSKFTLKKSMMIM